MSPVIVRLSNLARAHAAIRAIVPANEAETTVRDGLLAIIKTSRSQLRRRIVKQMLVKEGEET